MMTSYFNLLKYAATGQDSPDMTYYDRMRASTLMGGATVQTLTGQPPLSFKSDGTPLISWSMKGNGSQQGTPTPDNPVMPEFVGVRTAQLFDKSTVISRKRVTVNGLSDNNQYSCSDFIPLDGITSLCQNIRPNITNFYFFADKTSAPLSYYDGSPAYVPNGAKYVRINMPIGREDDIMLNLGSTALPYEPFGYKIPITCGGTTISVYTGDPLRKALDGSDAVDVLSSTGTITRAVDAEGNALATPTTQIVDVPEIPTVKGSNTLTVDTPIQPSEMTITFKG